MDAWLLRAVPRRMPVERISGLKADLHAAKCRRKGGERRPAAAAPPPASKIRLFAGDLRELDVERAAANATGSGKLHFEAAANHSLVLRCTSCPVFHRRRSPGHVAWRLGWTKTERRVKPRRPPRQVRRETPLHGGRPLGACFSPPQGMTVSFWPPCSRDIHVLLDAGIRRARSLAFWALWTICIRYLCLSVGHVLLRSERCEDWQFARSKQRYKLCVTPVGSFSPRLNYPG